MVSGADTATVHPGSATSSPETPRRIAIEHGQGNRIVSNSFDGDETAIRLWQNPTQDPNWGYPRHRDTRSHGYLLERNRFKNNKTALDIRATTGIEAFSNTFDGVGTRLAGDSSVDLEAVPEPHIISDYVLPSKLPGGIDPMIKDEATRGRSRIIVDEWGPYDWKHPKLWPAGRPDERPLRLRVLGPPGQWTLHALSGASISSKSGVVPGELTLTLNDTPYTDVAVTLDYRGADIVSPRGVRVAAGDVYRFSYSRFFVPIDWTVKFFAFGDGTHPVKEPAAFSTLTSGPALRTVSSNRLDYISGRAVEEGVPATALPWSPRAPLICRQASTICRSSPMMACGCGWTTR